MSVQLVQVGTAWSIAWGSHREPRHSIEKIDSWREAIAQNQTPIDPE